MATEREEIEIDSGVGGAAASSFQNSQIGSSSECIKESKSLRGGYTCCVPGYSNTKRDKELSFHKFPREEAVRKRWINAIKRKDFAPSEQHRVCSKHFMDGKKKGRSDVPCVFPLLPQPKYRKAPKLREPLQPPKKRKVVELLPRPLPDALVDEVICLCTSISNSYKERENVDLEKRLRRSTSVERFGL